MVEISSFYFWAYQILKDLFPFEKSQNSFKNLPKWQKSPNSAKTWNSKKWVDKWANFVSRTIMIIFRNSTILAFSKMIIPHEHPFQLIETIIFERNWDIHDGPSDSKILSGSSQKVFQIKKATFYRSRQIYTCNIFEWPMTAMLTHDWWVIKNDPWLWRTLFIAKLDIQVEQGIIWGLFGTLNSALWVIPIAI